MIKVRFKNNYENSYNGKEYTYKDYENAAVGDIVVVNTAYGYGVAKVSQIDIVDFNINPNILKSVAKVIKTQAEIDQEEKAEYDKKILINKFISDTKKNTLIKLLSDYAQEDSEYLKMLKTLTLEELERIYDLLK